MFEQGLWNTLCFKEHAQHYYTRHIHSSSGLSHLQHGPHQPQSYWLFRWADWQRLSCLVLECGRQTDIWESGCVGGGGGSRWRAEQKMKSSRHTSMSKYFERSGHSAVRCCYSSRFFFLAVTITKYFIVVGYLKRDHEITKNWDSYKALLEKGKWDWFYSTSASIGAWKCNFLLGI